MKLASCHLITVALLFTLGATAHAQLIDFQAPVDISTDYDASDIATNGTYVDALHTDNNASSIDVLNPTTNVSTTFYGYDEFFNVPGGPRPASTFEQDNSDTNTSITIAADGDNGGDGSNPPASPPAPTPPDYQMVLNGSTFVNYPANTPPIVGTVTMSGLTPGASYQVQVWASAWYRNVTYSSGNSQNLNFHTSGPTGQYVIGTFIAPAADIGNMTSSEYFTFYNTYPIDVSAGEINAISLRETPEPSTYAMLLVGLAVVGFCVRRKLAPQS